MSRYSKQQEYRLKGIFEGMPHVEFIEYYGSRYTKKGDFLIKVGGTTLLRVDHKSTEDTEKIRLQESWLPYLADICGVEDDGSIPVITLNIKRHGTIYAMSFMQTGNVEDGVTAINSASVAVPLSTLILHQTGNNYSVRFEGYTAYITTLEKHIATRLIISNAIATTELFNERKDEKAPSDDSDH